ncbi:MAG: BLUF domain-containing protein [Ottowia sp.]|uniref:BLUF domain-containing protein n=1 Tax=unclassified Ottowia TaxID=2645081 RepID=UPI003C2F8ABF
MLISYFLYTSRLVPEANVACVSEIVKKARLANAISGITGVLGFDGEKFVQYVEGPSAAILELLAAIERDPRHTDFDIKAQGESIAERRFQEWQMGYADLEEFPFDFRGLQVLRDHAALEYFQENAKLMDFA